MSSLRWFYALLIAVGIAGIALVFDRVTGGERHAFVQVVVAVALIMVFISLFGFMSKLRE